MSNVNRILLALLAWAVLGATADRWLHDAAAITPIRRIAWPQQTPSPSPTPRPTSTIFSATSSTACSVATNRFFSQGVGCTATYASGDLQWNAGNSTVTSITCSQPTDTTCDATFTFYSASGTPTALTCQLPATNSTTNPCTSSGSVSVTDSNAVAMAVKDSNGTCGAFAPTCTIFYTVP